MNSNYGNMAMIGELFGMAGFKKLAQKAMSPWNSNYGVYFFRLQKLANAF